MCSTYVCFKTTVPYVTHCILISTYILWNHWSVIWKHLLIDNNRVEMWSFIINNNYLAACRTFLSNLKFLIENDSSSIAFCSCKQFSELLIWRLWEKNQLDLYSLKSQKKKKQLVIPSSEQTPQKYKNWPILKNCA